jgi:hypothetical protein
MAWKAAVALVEQHGGEASDTSDDKVRLAVAVQVANGDRVDPSASALALRPEAAVAFIEQHGDPRGAGVDRVEVRGHQVGLAVCVEVSDCDIGRARPGSVVALRAETAAASVEQHGDGIRLVRGDQVQLAVSVYVTDLDRLGVISVGPYLVERGHVPPPEPGAPGGFSMASEERTRELLEGAGFTTVRIEGVAVYGASATSTSACDG